MHNEDKYEELVEDCISKKDLADVIQVTLERLMIEIKAEDSDKLVRSFSMYLHKFITKKVKEVDDKARDKAKHFCEKNKDFWIKGD